MILREAKGIEWLLNPNLYTQTEDFSFSNLKGSENNNNHNNNKKKWI